MCKRLVSVLTLVFIAAFATAALADKKSTPTIKLVRVEGNPQEFLLYPSEFTIGKTVSWEKAAGSDPSKDPVAEFTSPDPMTLSFELMFDGFESKENVREKFIVPLEGLTTVDANLKRPPMVTVTFPSGGFPSFSSVIDSISTRYTMFLADGTPVRATVNLRIRAASGARKRESNPCP